MFIQEKVAIFIIVTLFINFWFKDVLEQSRNNNEKIIILAHHYLVVGLKVNMWNIINNY